MELGEGVEDLEEEPKELGEEGEDLELGEGEQEVEDKAEEVGDGATNVHGTRSQGVGGESE